MPVDKQKILRFSVLDKCFRDIKRRYTLEDLCDECNKRMWNDLGMEKISTRTIQNDIKEMTESYDIELDETLREGRKRIYRYADTHFKLSLYNISDEERHRIEGAIAVLKRFSNIPQYDWIRNCLQQIANDRFAADNGLAISFQNNPDLYGIEHFEKLLKAICSKQTLQIVYKPYDQYKDGITTLREPFTRQIFPYHLKQFNNRWFLFAKAKEDDKLYNFALDRIQSIKNIRIKYQESDIDFSRYFDNTVGVTVMNDPQTIKLKVDKKRYLYIKTKPLHGSQVEIPTEETPTHIVLTLKVDINKELEALILSFGDDIEVLEPQHLRKSIADKIDYLSKKYELR